MSNKRIGCENFGKFYTEGKVRNRREWRGVKDTLYDYSRWLHIMTILAKFIVKPRNIKAMFRYRWMANYLAVPMMVDRHTQGLRDEYLRICHLEQDLVIEDVAKLLDSLFRGDRRIGNDKKFSDKVVLVDENEMTAVMMGFPTLKCLSRETPSTYVSVLLNQHAAEHYIDVAQEYGLAGDVCPMPEAEAGVSIDDDAPVLGACAVQCNTTCDGSLLGNGVISKRLELEDGIPVFQLAAPLRHREDDVQEYAAQEVRNAIAFIEEHTGEKWDWKAYFECAERVNYATKCRLEWLEMNKTDYPQVFGSNLALYTETNYMAICGKVPAFLGSSFAFLGGFATVANLDSGIFADMTMGEKLPYACGGIVVAGALYLILALIIKLAGVERVMHYLPPVVTGPIIICIGLSLAPSAIANASTNWLIALIALGTIIIFNIWGKGMFKIIPILMGVVISYAAAAVFQMMGMTNPDGSAILNFSEVATASWVGLPPFQLCKFDPTAVMVMAPIALATMMEHIGDMSAISATVGENFLADPGLHRTLVGDGIATSLSALVGGPANTTYGENTGVLELSRVHDPRVIRIAAVFAVILSFIPKMAEVIGSMPSAIIGGVSFMLYGMISAIGVRNVVENQVDLTKSRNLVIAAVILVCGLGFSDGLTFEAAGTSVTLTGLAIAAIAGVLLNVILPGNDYQFGKNLQGDINRGVAINPNPKKRQE